MNICMITSANIPPEEGIGNYTVNLSRTLVEQGNDVTIITRGNWRTKKEYDCIDGINIIKVFFLPFYPFYLDIHRHFLNKTINQLESQFDIIHLHTPLVPNISTKLPLITTVHTPMLIDSRYNNSLSFSSFCHKIMGRLVSYPTEMKIFARSDLISAVSFSVAKELEEYGLNSSKIIVVGNGVNEDLFYPISEKNDERYILYIGRLDVRKGIFDLIDCAKNLCVKYPELKFKIVGKGILLHSLKNVVKKYKLEKNVQFLGYVNSSDRLKLYQNATAAVIPSHYEGLPTTLLEAMSCGLPVIATSVSGALDVIKPEINGALIKPHSPSEMSDKIEYILTNSKYRDQLGENARKTILDEYTWKIISKNFLNNYKFILNNKLDL